MDKVVADEISFFVSLINDRGKISGINESYNKNNSESKLLEKAIWMENQRTFHLLFNLCDIDNYSYILDFYLYIPLDASDVVFCYCGSDASKLVTEICEELNQKFISIPRSQKNHSLLSIISLIDKQFRQKSKEISKDISDPETLRKRCIKRIEETLVKSPEEWDHYICLFYSALTSYRRSTILTPFPPQFISKSGEYDFLKIEEAFNEVTSIEHILQQNSLEALSNSSIFLLRWMLDRCSFTMKINKDQESIVQDLAQHLKPSYEIKLNYFDNPRFNSLAEIYGTSIGFHGSTADNFFSILHNGLKNMSGSKYMRVGAVLGDGIYLAEDVQVAKLFTKSSRRNWKKSIYQKNTKGNTSLHFSYIIVCEVINHPEYVQKIVGNNTKGEAYFVIQEEHCVRMHSLLIFSDEVTESHYQITKSICLFLFLLAIGIGIAQSILENS